MTVEITAPRGFFDRKFADDFANALYAGADELGQLEQFNVMSRTPVLTGALMSDVSYTTGSPGAGYIVNIYSGTENQLDEWGRVYDIYQEGGILGAGSNSGPANHHMFADIMTVDIAEIQMWGAEWLEKAADAIASGGTI